MLSFAAGGVIARQPYNFVNLGGSGGGGGGAAAPTAFVAAQASFGTNVSNGAPNIVARLEAGSTVRLQGQIVLAASQVFAANSILFTLAAQFIPPAVRVPPAFRTKGSGTTTLININADGTVTNQTAITAGGSGDTINFDAVTYTTTT